MKHVTIVLCLILTSLSDFDDDIDESLDPNQ